MQLTTHQQQAFQQIISFLQRKSEQIFILRGYAGTGKTTLVGKVVGWLAARERPCQLLATTGRAAKVLQNKTGGKAKTIHGCIYAFDEILGQDDSGGDQPAGQLQLNFNLRSNVRADQDLVYIIDEASMITHEMATGDHTARFGSGSLLHDLLAFAEGRQIIFVGDPAQLPPIAENPFSSALSPDFLQRELKLAVAATELHEIIRQDAGSEILAIAGRFREDIGRQRFVRYPKVIWPKGSHATLHHDHIRLQKAYVEQVKKHGFDNAVMVGFSNWQVNTLNRYIRKDLYPSWEIQPNELLMVVQNSYAVDLANGDQIILKEARFDSKKAGFTFLRVRVKALHNDQVYDTLMIRELLYNEQPGLSREEVQKLLIDFDYRMRAKGVKRKSQIYKEAMMTDPYLNALRAKFGYAVTCHKAQGGEWPHVFLNIHKSVYRMQNAQLYRWFYTALTRAREHLHLNDGWWIEGFDRRRPGAQKRFQSRPNQRE